ncbi:MAG TPA: hypothetical protein VJ672_03670 [Gemmatimonadaceae bacterium]|nr:hypothetical protein [Gemmatimonadaceae bacterium]
MRRMSPVMLLCVLAACDVAGTGGRTSASKADSITILNSRLAEAERIGTQQDSLMQDFVQTTKLLEEIDKQLSQVKGLKPKVSLAVSSGEQPSDPRAQYRATLLAKVESATELLSQSRARVRALSATSSKQKTQIQQFQETIASLESMVENQKAEILVLTQRVDSLTLANAHVTGERDSARDTVNSLRRDVNTVYYVVGTKSDLKKRGIIVEEGSKFLVFGRKALVPARKLDTSAFTAIDKWNNTEIALTAPKFRVISRHDASLIDAPRTPDGKVSGNLRITDPEQFWTTSKYLIIVEG